MDGTFHLHETLANIDLIDSRAHCKQHSEWQYLPAAGEHVTLLPQPWFWGR